jgi:hypothetical protein
MSNLLIEMTPELRRRYNVYAGLMGEARIPFGLNEVLRTKIRQLAYACQGRSFIEIKLMCITYNWQESLKRIINYEAEGKSIQDVCDVFRCEAGIYLLGGKEWYVVTKTLNSKHFPGLDGLSRAFDIKLLKNGVTPTWDKKWDADNDGIPEYVESAKLMKLAGLKAGADFGDYPHAELR